MYSSVKILLLVRPEIANPIIRIDNPISAATRSTHPYSLGIAKVPFIVDFN
jgi:hypothetical protein